MRHSRILSLALLIPALGLLAGTSGCGKKEGPAPGKPAAGSKTDGSASKGGALVLLEAPTDGVIKGQVVFDGTPPAPEIIAGISGHKDKDICLMGSENEKINQKWLVDPKTKGVANALVFLTPPAGKRFKLDNVKTDAFVEIDQPHCAFIPHVFALFPSYMDASGKEVMTGQKLKIKNSAPMNHNTKVQGEPTKNPAVSVTLVPKEEKILDIKYQGTRPIEVGCDFHNWMSAKGWTFNHPYFAVTKADGTFEIDNVPTGVELNVVAWHEGNPFFHGGQKGTPQTFKTGDNPLDLKVAPAK